MEADQGEIVIYNISTGKQEYFQVKIWKESGELGATILELKELNNSLIPMESHSAP